MPYSSLVLDKLQGWAEGKNMQPLLSEDNLWRSQPSAGTLCSGDSAEFRDYLCVEEEG